MLDTVPLLERLLKDASDLTTLGYHQTEWFLSLVKYRQRKGMGAHITGHMAVCSKVKGHPWEGYHAVL